MIKISIAYKFLMNKISDNLEIRMAIEAGEIKSIIRYLKNTKRDTLVLRKADISINDIQELADALKHTNVKTFYLRHRNMGDDAIKYLAEGLKGTRITNLFLEGNKIGTKGIRYLAQALKYAPINNIVLQGNNIDDEGIHELAKALAEALVDNKKINIDLCDNPVTTDAAESLRFIFNNTNVDLQVDIHSKSTNCWLQISRNNLYIVDGKLGYDEAKFINEIFKSYNLCRFGPGWLYRDNDYLVQAFKGIQIKTLRLTLGRNKEDVEYQIQAFKGAKIKNIYINSDREYITEFLQEIDVNNIFLRNIDLMDYQRIAQLATVLTNSTILSLSLQDSKISSTGIKYLVGMFKSTQILRLDLSGTKIGKECAKHLAKSLKDSKVIEIDLMDKACYLDKKSAFYADYKKYITIDSSAETLIRGKVNRINTSPVANKICKIFKSIVAQKYHSNENEFEFRIPQNKIRVNDIDLYVYLIDQLTRNRNIRPHLYNLYCKEDGDFVLDLINKLNEFVDNCPRYFSNFFNDIIPDLSQRATVKDFVYLVKQFEAIAHPDIVKNLLLHRALYYVNQEQDIMHPYIYILLNKYDMISTHPLFEPNKKDQVARYYQSHINVDGAKEIIDLFSS